MSKYKLFTDRSRVFKCDVVVEGASASDTKVRLVLETDKVNLVYNGKLNRDGSCSIPISKLKGILDEDTKGKMHLEVIAEDMYYTPYTTDFEVSRKVKVEVADADSKGKSRIDEAVEEDVKPKVSVKIHREEKTLDEHVEDVVTLLEHVKPTSKTSSMTKKTYAKYFSKYGIKDTETKKNIIARASKDYFN